MTDQQSQDTVFIPAYRVRLRFFSSVFIDGKAQISPFKIGGVAAELTTDPENYTPGKTSEVKINVRSIADADVAQRFGVYLRRAISVMAALRRQGVDLGEDAPTASLGRAVREQLEATGGHNIRNNMHGVDVFFEERPTYYIGVSATGYTSLPATRLAAQIEGVLPWIENVPVNLLQVANLLNAADNTPAEEAKIALTMSAIEALAPEIEWSERQRKPIADLHQKLLADSKSEGELEAVAATLNGILGGPGIGARLRRMLDDLGLNERWLELRELRKLRGKMMHGEHIKKSERIDVADRTRRLAAELFAASLRQQGLPDNAEPPPT